MKIIKNNDTIIQDELEMYKNIFNNAKDIIILMDNNGNIFNANQQAVNSYGYSFNEFLKLNILSIRGSKDWELISYQLKIAKSKGIKFEALHYRKDGTCFPVQVKSVKIHVDSKEYVISNIRDITEMKLKERQAQVSSKAKSQFITNINHEIRTPMNGILGMEQLLELTEMDSQQREYLDIIKSSSHRLLSTINDILDISGIQSEKVALNNTRFSLKEFSNRVIMELNTANKTKDLKINYFFDDSINNYLIGDVIRLNQVLTALIDNAIKFTNKGYIVIRVIKLWQINDKVKLKFSIEDTGIGISEDCNEKIFQAFNQANFSYTKEYEGAGLGLSISKKLVEMMNGEIWYESQLGKGSTFYFTAEFLKVI